LDLGLATLLFAAGLGGGAINAVAGGATLFTFPAMIAAGLPPIIANASSSVALTPGHLFAVFSERSKLPPLAAGLFMAVAIAAVGGFAGGYLLKVTSEKLFTQLVPALIGGATLIFMFGRSLQSRLTRGAIPVDRPASRLAVLVPVAVYGGYFGAGMGVVLMAAFSLTSNWELRTANAVKNLLSAVANWSAILLFVSTGMVNWQATLPMFVGACFGGLLGARLLRFMPPSLIRWTVIAAGTILTLVYANTYWF
jgi:uncharacterized protein